MKTNSRRFQIPRVDAPVYLKAFQAELFSGAPPTSLSRFLMSGVTCILHNGPNPRQRSFGGFNFCLDVLALLDPCRRESSVAQHSMGQAPVWIFKWVLAEIDGLTFPR